MLQCRLVFSQRPLMFSSDAARIKYVNGLLRGKALAWVQASSAHTHLNRLRFEAFVNDLDGSSASLTGRTTRGVRRIVYLWSNEGLTQWPSTQSSLGRWRRRPLGTRQPCWTCSAGVWAVQCVGGLRPKDLEELTDHAMEIDNHQHERRWERSFWLVSPQSPPRRGVSHPCGQSCSPPAVPLFPRSGAHAAGLYTPDRRGEAQMPQRRGLPVLWTDGSLHRQLLCAAKRLGSSVPPTSPCRSVACYSSGNLAVGAWGVTAVPAGGFGSGRLVYRLAYWRRASETGRANALVTRRTTLSTVFVYGNHHEQIQFLLILSSSTPTVHHFTHSIY